MKRLRLQLKSDQRGLVSIVVVSVIVVLLALITFGFSKVMDRELRQSLDQELSSQAYYAAESGLNDARSYVITAVKNNPSIITDPNKCLDLSSLAPFAANGDISGNNIVKYTCVLIDMQPRELIYDVNSGGSAVFKTNAAGLSSLYFSWENRHYATTSPQRLGTCSGSPLSCQLPQENAMPPDATGVLRVTIYPVYDASQYPAGTDPNLKLANNSRTYFLYPNSGTGRITAIDSSAVDYSTINGNGVFVPGNCNNSTHPTLPFTRSTQRFCNARIKGLPTTAAQYYVHISSVYKDLSVSIQGSDISSASLKLPGAEAVVDVTGVGNDVLRRVNARIPFDSDFAYPNNSINSMQTICKRFRLPKIGPGPTDYGPAVSDLGGVTDSTCYP